MGRIRAPVTLFIDLKLYATPGILLPATGIKKKFNRNVIQCIENVINSKTTIITWCEKNKTEHQSQISCPLPHYRHLTMTKTKRKHVINRESLEVFAVMK